MARLSSQVHRPKSHNRAIVESEHIISHQLQPSARTPRDERCGCGLLRELHSYWL